MIISSAFINISSRPAAEPMTTSNRDLQSTRIRGYFDVTGDDRSGLMAQVEKQRQRVTSRLADVGSVAAVVSGKGGVGKSYVAAAFAAVAAQSVAGGCGVLDADLKSPTVARLLDARGPLRISDAGVVPARGRAGVRVISTDLLLEEGAPLRWREPREERFVWRSVLESGALREFLADTAWGELGLLLVDMPPGADGVSDLGAMVADLRGVFAVTVPSPESGRSVGRTMASVREAGIPLLGVIENMSGYLCPHCDRTGPLFEGEAGAELAERFEVPLLGRVPFYPPAQNGGPRIPDEVADRMLEVLA